MTEDGGWWDRGGMVVVGRGRGVGGVCVLRDAFAGSGLARRGCQVLKSEESKSNFAKTVRCVSFFIYFFFYFLNLRDRRPLFPPFFRPLLQFFR